MARKRSVAKATPAPRTRYAKVREILSASARGRAASGAGAATPFWDESLEHFKEASIYGVRLIAPEQPESCCASGSASARSGLIKALRGEAPFDGRQYPPMPWGGAPVAAADIQFIADWIDDGCPPDDLPSIDFGTLEAKGGKVSIMKLADVAEFEAFGPGAKRYAYRDGEPRQRQNLDCLGEGEIERLRNAFRTLYDLDHKVEDRRNFNNQALIHQNHCQHGSERFLTWHRAYLYEFEQNLQDFDRDIMLPYWDWTMPQYRPEDPTNGSIIPQSFKAFLTPDAVEVMIAKLDPKPTKAQADAFRALAKEPTTFVSEHKFFCTVITDIGYTAVTPDPKDTNRQAMIDALLASNALWYPLRYPAEYAGGGTIEQVINYHYPTAADMAQIASLNNFRDFGGGSVYDAAFGFLDQNPHNTMHIWTGGMNPDAGLKAYACSPAGQTSAAMSGGQVIADKRNGTTLIANRKFHSREDLYSQPDY